MCPNKDKCKHDYFNFYRVGRALYLCLKCGRDTTTEVVLIKEAEDMHFQQGSINQIVQKLDEVKADFKSLMVIDEDKIKSLERVLVDTAKTDACYISEIINDLRKLGLGDLSEKYWEMLTAWQDELMRKAGFKDLEEVREYHDGCVFRDACQEYSDSNLPNID